MHTSCLKRGPMRRVVKRNITIRAETGKSGVESVALQAYIYVRLSNTFIAGHG